MRSLFEAFKALQQETKDPLDVSSYFEKHIQSML